MSESRPVTVQCPGCAKWKPQNADNFHRKGDGWQIFCKDCRLAAEEKKKQLKIDERVNKIHEQGLRHLESMVSGGASVPHTCELVEAFMEAFGGVKGFALATVNLFYECPVGSAQKVAVAKLVSSMIARNTELGGARKPYDMMDEDELNAEIQRRHMAIVSAVGAMALEHKEDIEAAVNDEIAAEAQEETPAEPSDEGEAA